MAHDGTPPDGGFSASGSLANGAAVVLISSELDEVLGLADRIGVMYRGKILGEVPAGTSPEEIGLLMAGNPPEQKEVS